MQLRNSQDDNIPYSFTTHRIWLMDACRVSMVTQRLVNVERKLRLEAEALAAERGQEAERLKGELTVLQAGFCTIFLLTCQDSCSHMACMNGPRGLCVST